jgi:hypothetical protein
MRNRRRNSVALLVALCGAAIVVGSFLSWVAARGRRPASGIEHTAISGLFHWSYQYSGSFLSSFAMVVVVTGALVIIGGVTASRFVTALFSLVALAAGGLWIGLNASHYSATNLPYTDLRIGAWLVVGGALIALISGFLLRRSRPGAHASF